MPGLNATIGADATGMEREYARMEAASARFAQRIQQNIIQGNRASTIANPNAPRNQAAEYVGWWKKAFEERDAAELAAARNGTAEQVEQARRNIRARALRRERAEARAERIAAMDMTNMPESWRAMQAHRGGFYGGPGAARGFGGASSAMFVSVARDSLASLASGASPITVFLQQAPQVGQAFTMMGSRIASMLLPAGLAIGGLTALGYAVGKAAQGLGALGVSGSGSALTAVLEQNRKILRARVETMRLEREEAERTLQARRAAASAGILGRMDDIGRMRMENRVLEAKTPEEAKKIREDYLRDRLDAARIEMENTKKDAYNRADPEAQKRSDEAQFAYENAKNALLLFQKTGEIGGVSDGRSGSGRTLNMLTDWERAGGSLGNNNLMLDVSKAQLTELKAIKELMRGRGNRGVQF